MLYFHKVVGLADTQEILKENKTPWLLFLSSLCQVKTTKHIIFNCDDPCLWNALFQTSSV